MIDPYRQQIQAEMEKVIGHCAKTLTKQKPEGTLGNWISDLIAKRAAEKLGSPVDFAVQNYGGIRIGSLPAGPISNAVVFELMPFDNQIVVIHLTGAQLQQFIDHMAASDGWPVSAGLRFDIAHKKPTNIMIGGEPLDDTRVYHFALPDYIANGGDNCFFLTDLPRDELPYMVRDAIADEVRALHAAGRQVTAELDGRIKIIAE